MIRAMLLAAALSASMPHVQWVMITADWCPSCATSKADFRPWMEKSQWRISEKPDAHVRLMDADDHPEMLVTYRVEALPTFILFRDGKEIERHVGYPGRSVLVRRYIEEHRK